MDQSLRIPIDQYLDVFTGDATAFVLPGRVFALGPLRVEPVYPPDDATDPQLPESLTVFVTRLTTKAVVDLTDEDAAAANYYLVSLVLALVGQSPGMQSTDPITVVTFSLDDA